MAKLSLLAGSTSVSVQVFIQDSSVSTGAGLTGLAYNTASLVASYVQPAGSRTAITLATLAAANSAWSSGGFKEIDATNCPGLYRLDIPNAALTGATHVTIHLKGAASMVPCLLEVELVAYNPFDAVRLGLTALPNAAAEAAGGLFTRGTGAGQIAQDANGRVSVNLVAILGTTLTETAGYIAAAFKKLFNVATPTAQADNLPLNTDYTSARAAKIDYLTGDAFARIGAAGAGLTAVGDTRLANLDAAVSSRLASASYSAPPSAASIRAEIDANSTKLDVATSTRLAAASYTAPLDSTATQAAAAAALTAYDPPTRAEATSDKDAVIAAVPTTSQISAAILAAGDVDGYSLEQTLKLCLAALAGKLSGAATTTITIRAADDSKDRITATVDADGARSAVTLDATG